jgi:phosphoribosylformimino-5-aminoimidazole carboxamide ribonucleotide (ProFAR) isomerase
MLGGPDLEQLTAVLAVVGVTVIASGGVASVDDLRQLAALEVGGRRLAGAIVGTAVYEGRVPIEEGIAACSPSA